MRNEWLSPISSQLVVKIGIKNVGDSAHRDVNILINILALKLCNFISMGFDDIGLEFFVYAYDDHIINASSC